VETISSGKPPFPYRGYLECQILVSSFNSTCTKTLSPKKKKELGIKLTRIGMENSLLSAKWAIVLLVVLHDDQAADAKCMAAAEFDGPPLNLHAHGARVVVDLRHVRQDLGVYLCAYGLG
jgi:hypothetical protein